MDKPEPDIHFKLTSFSLKIRDIFFPRINVLKEVGIKPGSRVLDYGCGSGAYIPALVELAGESGKIYALDIHPLAVQSVQNIASKKKLTNLQTILSDCQTGLEDRSIDIVLLYDVLHDLSQPDKVLEEIHRILKAEGILSLSDHHLIENSILSRITGKGLFNFLAKGKKTYSFSKV